MLIKLKLETPARPQLFSTAYDGSGSYGAVIKLAKQKSGWQEKTLLDFNGKDGGYAYGNIMVDATGRLYGTTFRGGNLSCNTVTRAAALFSK
jgi:hypothetical protein